MVKLDHRISKYITICKPPGKNVISIPQVAVLQDITGTFVYVVKEKHVTKIPVKVGTIVGKSYIIETGLSEGDLVIINNLTKIKPGIFVNI